ncbi:MAG: type II toxin-antitoxin system VapB family antitoxin [Algoriphagus sp.]|nr:type II toxin-antitoxin system VapB family antitoxin [Algoriphagus sp.]MDO8965345.1 type II toxin-antitoxin system VapB family antitoxin [Algoriphagus sp.]MDP3198777.1 type II toxin-antitoxin system VapB family antitoxin [Algoriphagus sp.]
MMKITSIKTKKEVVHRALEEYLRRLKLTELAGLAGEIEWESDRS